MNAGPQGLTAGFAAAAALFVTSQLMLAARREARREGATSVLEYGRPIRLLIVVLWLFVAVGGGLALFAAPEDRWIAACVVGGFFLMVLVLHLEFFRVRIAYDKEGIGTRSPWRFKRSIPWEEITGVRFSNLALAYVISTQHCGRVTIHLYLSGVQSLLDELKKHGFDVPPLPTQQKPAS